MFCCRLKCASDSNIKLEMFVNKLELYVNGELLDSSHDRKILSQIPLRDKTVIVAKVYYKFFLLMYAETNRKCIRKYRS